MARKTKTKKAINPKAADSSSPDQSTIDTDIAADENKAKRGRPSSYDPDTHPSQAFTLTAKLGADVDIVAEIFKVSRDTIYRWIAKYPEFADAINGGRELFDSVEVEGALLKRALGYQIDEKTFEVEQLTDEDGKQTGETKLVHTSTVRKHIIPSVTAIMFWLQNRQADRWKNVRKVEGSVDHRHAHLVGLNRGEGLAVDFSTITKEDAEQLRSIIKKSSGGPSLLPGTGAKTPKSG